MILLIGGMGFIGLNTALRLLDVGERVVITQYSTRRVPTVLEPELDKRVFIASMDVTKGYEVMDVIQRHKVESIISFAAPPARGISAQEDYRMTKG